MQATLNSNSGGAAITLAFGASSEYAHDPGFDASIDIRGQHWDGDHTFPIHSSVSGVWLRAQDVAELRDFISRWLAQPLEQLRTEGLDGEFQLARLPEQNVTLRFGSREDTISHLNPVVTAELAAGALRVEFHFVTDQSCLTIFSRELTALLSQAHASQTA